MKKLLSLIVSVILIFTVVGAVPIVSAEEIEYEVIPKGLATKYWEELYDEGVIVKSGAWYFALDINGESFTVCGYDGEESDITIPTKLNGANISTIRDFYLISNTVKTIRIPSQIFYIDELDEYADKYQYGDLSEYNEALQKTRTPVFDGESPVENIIVDSDNEFYASKDGVLFTKNFVRLIYYPVNKSEEQYVVPDTVKYITNAAFADAKNLKSLTITPGVEDLGYASLPKKGLEQLYFVNTALPKYQYYLDFVPSEDRSQIKYIPNVPDAVVYCVEGSELYKAYKKSFAYTKKYCKELKVIPRKDGESLIKENGVWYYYDNGEKADKNTLIKHSGVWFYINNGVWDKTVTDKIIKYKDKWFYIKNGKWNSNVNTLTKQNGEWLGIVNGKWDTTKKTLVKYKGIWFYVKNGEWCKETAIVKYKNKLFYVKKGKVDFDYSGTKKINGKTYKIKYGKVA